MGNIDGEWESCAQSPMGEQRSVLKLASQGGGGFAGTSAGPMGEAAITDGVVDGDRVRFKINMTRPFPMTLTVTGEIKGDMIDGQIDTGAFGKFPMKASRRG